MERVFVVEVVADYDARSAAELSLVKGMTMTVVGVDPSGVWGQSKDKEGRVGWLPLSYTKMSVPQAESPRSITDSRPLPAKQTLEKLKTKVPCSVVVHVIRGRLVETEKVHMSVMLYRSNILSKERKVVFQTERKKSCPLEWNEQFVMFIQDPEVEVLSLALSNGSTFKSKVIGEVDIPLRGTVRDFDKPKGKLQWFSLHNKTNSKKIGELLVFLEFEDSRVTEGPRDFQHTTHIGLTPRGDFEMREVPPEFKPIIRHLQNKNVLNGTEEVKNLKSDSPIVTVSAPVSLQVQNPMEQNETPTAAPALPIQQLSQQLEIIRPQCEPQAMAIHFEMSPAMDISLHTETKATKDWDVQDRMEDSGPLLDCTEDAINDQCGSNTEISFIHQIQNASHHLKKTEIQKPPPSMNGLLKEAFTRTRPLITGNKLDSDEEWSD